MNENKHTVISFKQISQNAAKADKETHINAQTNRHTNPQTNKQTNKTSATQTDQFFPSRFSPFFTSFFYKKTRGSSTPCLPKRK